MLRISKKVITAMTFMVTAALATVVPTGTASAAETIELRSGVGSSGSQDVATELTRDGGATWQNAWIVQPHPAYSVLPTTNYVSVSANGVGAPQQTVRYRTTFELPGGASAPSIEVAVHADNAATVLLNGTVIGAQPHAEIFQNFQDPAELFATSDSALFQTGVNSLEFDLRNFGDPSGLDYLATVQFTPNTPPDCSSVAATPGELWPPNHTMRTVALDGAGDPDGDAVTITIHGVTQDEPVAGPGRPHEPDAAVRDGSNEVDLRAEREGTGDGRVYRIAYIVDDGAGGTCSGTASVGVPRDQRPDGSAADSGGSFDSFGA